MSWIQLNSFSFALSGVTLLGVAGLFYYGKEGGTRYEKAKADFEEALSQVTSIERTVPYPTTANSNGKKKAIEEYKKDVEALQEAFARFRPGELKMVSPEQFIDRLKQVNLETRGEFERNNVTVPELYFVGFKDYTSKFPNKSATGILNYQLEGIREMQLALAKSGVSELKNLHRPVLEEENGLVFKAPADMVARPLPLEISFRSTESAARQFLSALTKSDNHFWVIRSLRIANMKKDPPKTSDAKFAVAAAGAPGTGGRDPIFNFEELLQQGNPPAPGAEGQPAVPSPPPAAPVPAPAVPSSTGNRILALILGSEELVVHLRLDLMLILAPKQLP